MQNTPSICRLPEGLQRHDRRVPGVRGRGTGVRVRGGGIWGVNRGGYLDSHFVSCMSFRDLLVHEDIVQS